MQTPPTYIEEAGKLFDEKFDKVHNQFTHLNDREGKLSCETCKRQRELNPKGYYKTFLTENKCYWNDEMFNDVKSFLTQSLQTARDRALEEVEREVENEKIKPTDLSFSEFATFSEKSVSRGYNMGIDKTLSILTSLKKK